jgi:hypothetical protein
MKHSMLAIVILICAAFLAGCSKPCFHRAGASIEQCKRDLLQCIDHARVQQKSQLAQRTRSCMQAKGYECLDANKTSPDVERIVVMTSFETYWVLDGLEATPAGPTVTAHEEQQQSVPETPQAKPIGYRARLDENGKHTLIPVYEHEQTQETNSPGSADGGK